ncbi:DUF6493 family protein [Nonomuraea sp. NPDC050643]|uniref:DUF7825 domain-containing protein n=1 Tax=Nonomuraea sp. NPDC050643 TaxID=3155660 RepID=UPI0033CBC2F9
MSAWDDLLKHVRAGDTAGTIRFVTELDTTDRKKIAAELPRYVTRTEPSTSWWEWRTQVPPLLMAGAVCLGGAAAVTTWLFRREFRRDNVFDGDLGNGLISVLSGGPDGAPGGAASSAPSSAAYGAPGGAANGAPLSASASAHGAGHEVGYGVGPRAIHGHGDGDGALGCLLGLLRRRPVVWQEDVARRMAGRLRLPEVRYWGLVAQLVRETGIEPPDGQAFMAGWLRALRPGTAAGDPLFMAYKRRIFEIDGLDESDLWQAVEAIMRLVDDGLIERTATIDGVVGRLLRDGPSAPVPFVGLHDRLDLDIDESAARARHYTRLLPAGPVAVVDLALAQLRRLEEAGRLEEELFAEALGALVYRPEKKLLRAALSWAGDAVLRDAGRTDVVLEAVSTLFTQDTLALQERAVRLAVKLAPGAGQAGHDAVRNAAPELHGDLLEKVSAAYGGGIAAAEPPVAAPPAAVNVPRMPPPIASPEELVRELAAFTWPLDVHTFERLLAGLAEWSYRDPDTLREALHAQRFEPDVYGDYRQVLHEGLPEVVHRAFLAFASPDVSRRLSSGRRTRHPTAMGPLDRLYVRRARELVTPFEDGTGYPVLLATPTMGTGHLDPATLLDRLEHLETAGVEALPADLAQALLRLPRTFSEMDAERARRLTSAAGRTCAAWMRGGGPPDPNVTVSWHRHRDPAGCSRRRMHIELNEPSDEGLSRSDLRGDLRSDIGSDPGDDTARGEGVRGDGVQGGGLCADGMRRDGRRAEGAQGGVVRGGVVRGGGVHGEGVQSGGAVRGEGVQGGGGAGGDVCADGMRRGGVLGGGVKSGALPIGDGGFGDDVGEVVRGFFEIGPCYAYDLAWWPLVMPAHREIVAAHLAGQLLDTLDSGSHSAQVLAGLAHGDGPLGYGMAYALACGMGHASAADRAAATDAFLTLAVRGEVPVRELGEAVATLAGRELVKLHRVVSALDDATQAGAQEAVWAVIVQALPGLLPEEGERPRAGVADLVAAGARAARIAGARGELPCAAVIAARKGSSRLILEARRLMRLIRTP